ncbi:MAG: hypothetical protein K2L94_03300, partial [Alphaproteobacteria bacterium]|nr:hypothetical protein [Alphaproteobacteria bacterium]
KIAKLLIFFLFVNMVIYIPFDTEFMPNVEKFMQILSFYGQKSSLLHNFFDKTRILTHILCKTVGDTRQQTHRHIPRPTR